MKAAGSTTSVKFPSLEAFRGLAAIMVVLYHSRFYAENTYVPLVKNSDIFVDFFFILSGFVMAYAYLDKIGKDVGLKKFVLLRFGRLYPLHLFVLLLWIPYIAVKLVLYQRGVGDTDPGESNNAFTFASNIFLLQAFDGYQPLSWNFPSWSISAEFYTYVIFFIVIFYISKLGVTRHLPIVALIAVGAYLLAFLLDGSGVELFLVQAIGGFFLGILLFLFYSAIKFPHISRAVATTLEVAALLFLVYSVANNATDGFSGDVFFYVSVISFLVVIYVFVIQEKGYISILLKTPPFQYLGRLSYSIYMTHALVLAMLENIFVYVLKFNKSSFDGVSGVIVFASANIVNCFALGLVILISTFTYQFIEVPWRSRFKRYVHHRPAQGDQAQPLIP